MIFLFFVDQPRGNPSYLALAEWLRLHSDRANTGSIWYLLSLSVTRSEKESGYAVFQSCCFLDLLPSSSYINLQLSQIIFRINQRWNDKRHYALECSLRLS